MIRQIFHAQTERARRGEAALSGRAERAGSL
jgi:hypothetical protein